MTRISNLTQRGGIHRGEMAQMDYRHRRSTREERAREGHGAGRERKVVYLVHRHLPAAADGLTRALLVDPRVRACVATGARRRRHIGTPSRTATTTTTAAAAAAAST